MHVNRHFAKHARRLRATLSNPATLHLPFMAGLSGVQVAHHAPSSSTSMKALGCINSCNHQPDDDCIDINMTGFVAEWRDHRQHLPVSCCPSAARKGRGAYESSSKPRLVPLSYNSIGACTCGRRIKLEDRIYIYRYIYTCTCACSAYTSLTCMYIYIYI